jgi:RNA polymerase sigma-70 factor (ECF subfamily)
MRAMREAYERPTLSLDDRNDTSFHSSNEIPKHEVPSDLFPGPETAALEHERREHVRAAIARLSDKERDVIILAHYKQLSLSEIGRRWNVSRQYVCTIRDQAFTKLREMLAGEMIPA